MKFIIDRNTWLRGEGEDQSKLLRESDGKMCCLGFYSLACGLSKEQINNQVTPIDLYDSGNKIPEGLDWLAPDNNTLTKQALKLMKINDLPACWISVEDREAKIIAEFASQGIQVEFIN